MSTSVELNIPEDSKVRARRDVIRAILGQLITHGLTLEQTIQSIEHLITVETDDILDRCHLSNKAEA